MGTEFVDSDMLGIMGQVSKPSQSRQSKAAAKLAGVGVSAVSGSKNDFIILQNLISPIQKFYGQLAALSNRLRNKPPEVQNKVAYAIAQVYRNRLRRGVGQKLSPLTKVLTDDHKPLSTLADHVVVRQAQGYRPAVVTFENSGGKSWARIAWMLENGYWIDVKARPDIKARLFWIAQQRAGTTDLLRILDDPGSGRQYWEVPPRPHQHFLRDKKLDAILREFSMYVFFGQPMSPQATWMLKNTTPAKRTQFKIIEKEQFVER